MLRGRRWRDRRPGHGTRSRHGGHAEQGSRADGGRSRAPPWRSQAAASDAAAGSAVTRSRASNRIAASSATANAAVLTAKPAAITSAPRPGRPLPGFPGARSQHDGPDHSDAQRPAELSHRLQHPRGLRSFRRRDPAERVRVRRRDRQAQAEPGQRHSRHLQRVRQIGQRQRPGEHPQRRDREPGQHRRPHPGPVNHRPPSCAATVIGRTIARTASPVVSGEKRSRACRYSELSSTAASSPNWTRPFTATSPRNAPGATGGRRRAGRAPATA